MDTNYLLKEASKALHKMGRDEDIIIIDLMGWQYEHMIDSFIDTPTVIHVKRMVSLDLKDFFVNSIRVHGRNYHFIILKNKNLTRPVDQCIESVREEETKTNMETKFKVGDEVEFKPWVTEEHLKEILITSSAKELIETGEGVVRDIGENLYVAFNGNDYWYIKPEYMQLKTETMKKRDLKTGMLVVLRGYRGVKNEDDYLIVLKDNVSGKDALVAKDGSFVELKQYNELMEHQSFPDLTIVQVYGSEKINHLTQFNTEHRKHLWTRNTLKMTMKELCEKLGVDKIEITDEDGDKANN